MKLNSFKFQDGKVLWLPEYPGKEPPAYEFINPEDDLRRRYDKAIAHSLASAIEVAPEDVDRIRFLIVTREDRDINTPFPPPSSIKVYFDAWVPENGKVCSAECEMERVEQWALKGTHEWYNDDDERFDLHHPDDTDYRQVAHLKHKEEIFPAANSHDMKEKDHWRVESSTSPIADTGDYYTQLWLTNGVVNLYSEKDDNETELQAIADQLNQNKPA